MLANVCHTDCDHNDGNFDTAHAIKIIVIAVILVMMVEMIMVLMIIKIMFMMIRKVKQRFYDMKNDYHVQGSDVGGCRDNLCMFVHRVILMLLCLKQKCYFKKRTFL